MESIIAQKIKLQSSRSFPRTQSIQSQTRFDSLLQTKLAETSWISSKTEPRINSSAATIRRVDQLRKQI